MPFIGLLGLWFFAELAVLVFLIIKLGFLLTLGLQLLSSAIGFALLRHRQTAMANMMQSSNPNPDAARESIYHLTAGILFIIPGFLSSLLALVFLIPPLRKVVGTGLLKILTPDAVMRSFNWQQQKNGTVYEYEESEVSATREDGSVIQGELIDERKHTSKD